jgi:hypothetical protein
LYGDSRGGEKDALNYHAIVDSQGVPMGTNNPYREQFLRHRDLMDPFDPKADMSLTGLVPKTAAPSSGGHAGHILDHMAPPPPKSVTIQDHSGGMIQYNIG